MNKTTDFKNVIVCREKLSSFWIVQWTNGRGKRIRRSTKVPAKGGIYQGERLSSSQAERRALMVAIRLAQEEEAYAAANPLCASSLRHLPVNAPNTM